MSHVDMAIQDGVLKIRIVDSFDLSLYSEFVNALPKEYTNIHAAEIDLSQVDYMDSSGIGMILMLRQKLSEGTDAKITLLNPNGVVKNLLNVAKLSEIMTVK